MKGTFLLLLILATAQVAAAQDWAKEKLAKSPRHYEWVTVKHDGRAGGNPVGETGARPSVLAGRAPALIPSEERPR